MCQNAFGQSDCRILQSAISQEKSERPSRFFECKLTQNFPKRKYYCAGMGDQACLKYLKQVCNILLIEIDVFYCRISSCRISNLGEKQVRHESNILHEDKNQSFLEADTIVFGGHNQTCPKYSKQQVFALFLKLLLNPWLIIKMWPA